MPNGQESGPGGSAAAVSIEDIRSWWKVPAIAHFCSLFRSTFNLPDYEIEDLEEALFLDAGQETSPFLPDLLVALLKGCFSRKDISVGNWDRYLRDFMKQHWELVEGRVNPLNLEDATFKGLPTLIKVEILHSLCDFRLDAADVSLLKDYQGEQLRVDPLGVDSKGAKYWYFYSTRLYKEDPAPSVEDKEAKRKKKDKEKVKKKKEKEAARKKRLQETVKARKALEKQLAKKKPSKAKKLIKPLKSDNETCSDDNIPLRQLCKKKTDKNIKEDKPLGRGKGKRKMEEEEEKVEEPEEVNENGKRKKKMPVKKNAKKMKKEEIMKEEQGSDADSESEEDDNPKSKKKKKEKKTRKMIKKEELETETECEEEVDKKRRKPSSPRGKGKKKEEVSMESQDESEVGKKGKKGKSKKEKVLKQLKKEETATSAESEMDVSETKRKKGKGAVKKKRKKGVKSEESQEEMEADQKKGKKNKKQKGKKGKDTATESEAVDEEKEEQKGKGKKKSKLQKLKKESSVDLQSGSDLDSKKGKKLIGKKKKVKTDVSSQDESQEDKKLKIKQEMKDTTDNDELGDGKIKKRRRKKKEIKSKEIITATESDTEIEQETSKPGSKKDQRTTSPGRVTRRGTPTKADKEQLQKDKSKDKGNLQKGKKATKGKTKNVQDASSQSEDDKELKSKKGSKAAQKGAKGSLKKSSQKLDEDMSQDSQEDGCETTKEISATPSKTVARSGLASKSAKSTKASRKSCQETEEETQDCPTKKTKTAQATGKKQPSASKKSSNAPSEDIVLDEREALKELQALHLMENMLKVASDDSSSDSSSEEEPETARWHLICHTEEDWERLTESFKRARNKAERELYLVLKEDFLSEIHNIFAAKERALRRKLQEMVPRRTSGRIADIKVRQEEEERMQSFEAYEEAQREEAEEAVRKISLRRRNRRQGEYAEEVDEEEEEEDEEEEDGGDDEGEEEEDEGEGEGGDEDEDDEEEEEEEEEEDKETIDKVQQEKGDRGIRARLRAKNASPEPSSDDLTSSSSVPYDLGFGRTTRSSRSQLQAEQEKEKLKKSFAKVLDATKAHYEAWPFIDPVQESYAPNYYSIIKVPMDIATMDLKVEERMYHSINDFVNDMDLIFQNCVQYNGRKSEYTLMARKVEACFRRALKKQFPNFRKKNANCRHPVPKPVFTDSQDEGETDSQCSQDSSAAAISKKKMKDGEEEEEEEKGGREETEGPSPGPSPCPSPASYHSEDYAELKSAKGTLLKVPKKWKEDDEDGDDEEEDDDDDDGDEINERIKKSVKEKQSCDVKRKSTSPPPKEDLILSEDEDSNKKKDKTKAYKVGPVNDAISSTVTKEVLPVLPEKTSGMEQRPGPSYMPMSLTRYVDNVDKPRAHVPPMVATPLRQSTAANSSHQPKPLQVKDSGEDKNRLQSSASNDERKAQFSPTSKTSRDSGPIAVQKVSGQSITDRSMDKSVYPGDQLLHKGVVHHGVVQGPEPLAVQPIVERNTAIQHNSNRSSYQEMIDLNARRPPPSLQSPWYSGHSDQSNKTISATQAVPPLIQDGSGTQGSMLQPPPTSGNTEQRTHEIIPMQRSGEMQQRPLQSQPQNHPQSNSQIQPQSHTQNHPQSHLHPYPVSLGMGGPLEHSGAPPQWGMPHREVEPSPAKLWRPLAVDSPSVTGQVQPFQSPKAPTNPTSPLQYPATTQSVNQSNAAPLQSAPPQSAPMSETMQRLASQGSPNAHHGSSTTATELLRSMAAPTHTATNPPRPSQDVSSTPSIQSNPLTDGTSRPSSSFRLPSHSAMPNAIPSGYPGYMSTQRVPTPGIPPHLGAPSAGLDPSTYPGYSGPVPTRKDTLFDPMRTGHTSPFPTAPGAKPDIFNTTGRLTPSAGIHPSLSSHRSSAFNQPQSSALYASQLHHAIPTSQTLPSSYPGLSSPSHLRTLLQGRQGPIPEHMVRMGQPDMGMLQRNPYLEQSAYGSAPAIDPRYATMYSQQYNPSMTQQPMGSSVPYQVGSSNSYFPGQAPHPQSYHSLNSSHVPPVYRR